VGYKWCVMWWACCRAGCVWWVEWRRGWEPQYFMGGWNGNEYDGLRGWEFVRWW